MKLNAPSIITRLSSVALLVISAQFGFSQIHQGSLTLSTQTDVDSVASLTEVTGDLFIVDSLTAAPISNLDGLGSLRSVGGDLFIARNAALVDTLGLLELTDVGGLVIMYNASLGDLDGLSNLAIADWMYIADNTSLDRYCGLDLLFQVQGTEWAYEINDDGTGWYYSDWGDVLPLIGGPCELAVEDTSVDPELYVDALFEEGLLNQGEAKALTKQIRQAKPKALLNHLAALVRSGRLSDAEAQPIIDSVIASE